jgi:CHAT domain-containing protein
MPTTPGFGKLPYAAAEAAGPLKLLPDPVLLIEPGRPDGDQAPTKSAVLDLLPDRHIAHFACHGHSHPADPSRSLLLLHDHGDDPLTVESLIPIQLDRAQLAYLSACRTAMTANSELADEAIHLTSAFQLAGFPHVIGTLWEISDAIAVTVAEAFYTNLRARPGFLDTGQAAHALHKAVRALRDSRPEMPFLWAAYLHSGA